MEMQTINNHLELRAMGARLAPDTKVIVTIGYLSELKVNRERSLREQYAMAALTGYLSNGSPREWAVEASFVTADLMLKASE